MNQYFINLTRKADQGDNEAINTLIDDYDNDRDEQQVFDQELINFYLENSNNNGPYSTYYLGLMYLTGKGVTGDVEKGTQLIKKSMQLNCSQAYYLMTILHETEICQDEECGTYSVLLSKAIKLNNSSAYLMKALEYENTDLNEYLDHLRKAAELGNSNAWCRLGQYYQDNEDYSSAIKYYSMGDNNSHCLFNLAIMYMCG